MVYRGVESDFRALHIFLFLKRKLEDVGKLVFYGS